MTKTVFDIDSTNACKGVALILLLWHHLFYQHPEFGFITFKFASLSKVCLAIFVILSGYGYSESVKSKDIGLLEFYKKRLVNLYSTYWFIALIFVPIGVLFFDRTFQEVFTSYVYAKFFIQMVGLHRFVYSEYGYNATWWYMSVIIPLVILFPFIYDLVKKYGILIIIFCFIILLPDKSIFPVLNKWMMPFAIGIYLSHNNYVIAISKYFNKYGSWRFIILISLILLIAILRGNIPFLEGTEMDWLFGSFIILFVFEFSTALKLAQGALCFLGKHLFNIFLFHTFIYYYYWSEFIYSLKNPILIFIALLSICTVLSLVIEQIKRRLFLYKIVEKVIKLQIPSNIEIEFQQNARADARTSLR